MIIVNSYKPVGIKGETTKHFYIAAIVKVAFKTIRSIYFQLIPFCRIRAAIMGYLAVSQFNTTVIAALRRHTNEY